MKLQRFLSIPVFAVIMLLSFVYYITIFIFINDWVSLQSSSGFLNALIFTFLEFFCLLSLLVCVLTDPGGVPSSYEPDVLDQESQQTSAEAKRCDKCSAYKPPRAHHCKVCKQCILRMDHHCLWINNCVGYWNYKAFFILIFYATVGSIYSTVMILSCALQKDWELSGTGPLKAFYAACGVVMICLSLTLGTLLGWHIYLMTRNMTTIEYYEGIRASWLASKSGQSYHHPFDVNNYKNISSVLGSNMLKWLCPTAMSHLKDGLSFPTSHNS